MAIRRTFAHTKKAQRLSAVLLVTHIFVSTTNMLLER